MGNRADPGGRLGTRRTDYWDDPAAPTPKLLVPGGSALVVDDRGRVLLQQRADFGNWSLPGGVMEFGEGVGGAVACPKTHQPLMNVPVGAAAGQLVPAAPTRALVCTYPPASTARWPLGSSKAVNQAELDGLVAYLNRLPAWTQETGEADGCLAAGVAEHQIVLGYAAEAPATVSVSVTCAVVMNGPAARRLTSATELARFWAS
jgi:hypothetical protein